MPLHLLLLLLLLLPPLLLLLHGSAVWASKAITVVNMLRTEATLTLLTSSAMDEFLLHDDAPAEEQKARYMKEASTLSRTYKLASMFSQGNEKFDVTIPVEEKKKKKKKKKKREEEEEEEEGENGRGFACACRFVLHLEGETAPSEKSVLLFNEGDPLFQDFLDVGQKGLTWLIDNTGLAPSNHPSRHVIEWRDKETPTWPLLPKYQPRDPTPPPPELTVPEPVPQHHTLGNSPRSLTPLEPRMEHSHHANAGLGMMMPHHPIQPHQHPPIYQTPNNNAYVAYQHQHPTTMFVEGSHQPNEDVTQLLYYNNFEARPWTTWTERHK